MNRDARQPRRAQSDPDPIVVDLLVNLAGMAIGGLLKKVATELWNRRNRNHAMFEHQASAPPLPNAEELRRLVTQLDADITEAAALILPRTKRELGGQLLLDSDTLARYQALRDKLFGELRAVDRLAETLPAVNADTLAPQEARAARLPAQLRSHLRFVERRLRDARSATLSGDALLEMKAAVLAMHEVVKLL